MQERNLIIGNQPPREKKRYFEVGDRMLRFSLSLSWVLVVLALFATLADYNVLQDEITGMRIAAPLVISVFCFLWTLRLLSVVNRDWDQIRWHDQFSIVLLTTLSGGLTLINAFIL